MPFDRISLHLALSYIVLIACQLCAVSVCAQSSNAGHGSQATPEEPSATIPIFRSTSALVYLDVTVVDKSGHVVATGLSQDDFSVTEDGKPQRIFSFEAPEAHLVRVASSENAEAGDTQPKKSEPAANTQGNKAPAMILVLDMLNTQYSDMAFVRDEGHKFLAEQPETLPAPTELMVLGNTSFRLLVAPTRSREKLLDALDHLPRSVPFKAEHVLNFMSEMIRQSYDALQQMSIQNRGVPGRKNVIWVGAGPPSINDSQLSLSNREAVRLYVRDTVNLMVESRITLFLVYPQFEVGATAVETKAQGSNFGTGVHSTESYTPFAEGNRSFTEFADKTGGRVFNQNNVSVAMQKSVELGSTYYTLTYQPVEGNYDGHFRKIRVLLRNPDLQVLTKAGYFSREPDEPPGSFKQEGGILRDAAAATVPFSALDVRVAQVVRHPDAGMVEITFEVDDSRLHWPAAGDGAGGTTVVGMGVTKSAHGDVLKTRMARYPLRSVAQTGQELGQPMPRFKMTLPLSRDVRSIRLAVTVDGGDRVGTADLDRKTIDGAPEAPTANPGLQNVRLKPSKVAR